MSNLEKELTVKINKICRSPEFIKAYCSKFKFAPAGMTIDIEEKPNAIGMNRFVPVLMVKHYGYESLSDNGLDIYSDLLDYDVGDEDFTDEQISFVFQYFKENHFDVYKYFKF